MRTLIGLIFLKFVASATHTPSPSQDFIAAPTDVTVIEGYPAVLKCKLRDPVHTCQWFYLEEGLDIFDVKNRPILVKEHRPSKDRDCSIKFSKTRTIQSGQWLCKGLQIHTRKYMVSEPAQLTVLPKADESSQGEVDKVPPPDPEATGTPFVSTEGYILNAEVGEPVLLGCNIQSEQSNCLWIAPDERKIYVGNATKDPTHEDYYYQIKGKSIEGNCSLFIKGVREQDEGNWQCSTDEEWPVKGPIIHLHIEGYHSHENGTGILNFSSGNPLIPILVVFSLVLLVIIIALIVVIYRRVWGTHNLKPLESGRESPTSNKFRASFSDEGQQCLIYDTKQPSLAGSEMSEIQIRAPDGAIYTKYLDMSGGSNRDSYVAFPDSNADRASFISRKTVTSSGHPGSDSGHGSMQSGPPESFAPKPPLERTVSGCSDHLYEEIPEKNRKYEFESIAERPSYINLETEEDQEGYMIPNRNTLTPGEQTLPKSSPSNTFDPRRSPLPAPPYSKVSNMGLMPSSQRSSRAMEDLPDGSSNPAYAMAGVEPLEDYDVPRSSPVPPITVNDTSFQPEVPERTDSAADPLANYDVPNGTPLRSNTPNLMV